MEKTLREFIINELKLKGILNPTNAEINQFWIKLEKAKEISDNNIAAYNAYISALEAGYRHTDGALYYANERATNDMVKALSLFGLDSREPLPTLDMEGKVHPLYIEDFQALASAIGRYQY